MTNRKTSRTKPQTEVERELTRIIRKMVRDAERDMVRTAHSLAKAIAFNIDVKGLAQSLQGPGVVKDSSKKPKHRHTPAAQETP